ncbi:MAG: guanylate kinase, partial [Lachnospiraceae bacterium]|nr:guanylate kinase [Lachnospiraceae bacterium]
MSESVRIVVISGFSGAGKGTVIKRFLENNNRYFFSVSATTRESRPAETHGVD